MHRANIKRTLYVNKLYIQNNYSLIKDYCFILLISVEMSIHVDFTRKKGKSGKSEPMCA